MVYKIHFLLQFFLLLLLLLLELPVAGVAGQEGGLGEAIEAASSDLNEGWVGTPGVYFIQVLARKMTENLKVVKV